MAFYLLIGGALAVGAFLFFTGFDGTNRQPVLPPRAQLLPRLTMRDRIDAMFQANEQWAASATVGKSGKLSLAEQLSRADLKLRTSEWIVIRIGSAAVVALVGVLRVGLGAYGLQPILLGLLGFFIPQFYLG